MPSHSSSETISLIIPAHNSEQTLPLCLDAIRASTHSPLQIIVVDDASIDQTSEVARLHGAIVYRLTEHHHVNHCRNLGAEKASGDILFFLDSDVIIQPHTIQEIFDSLDSRQVDAVIGLYSTQHRHDNTASQYKNLWIRYSYLKAGHSLDWIFGAVAAIRKEAFDRFSGFDSMLILNKGGDLELGKRMVGSHLKIMLNPRMDVEHLKRHTIATLLRNDFERSRGFVELALRLDQLARSLRRGFVNVYAGFAYSAVLSWLFLVSAIFGIWWASFRWIAPLTLIVYLALNIRFLLYFGRHRRMSEVPAVLVTMFLDHLACNIGCIVGFLRWTFSK
jgi:glycosyltransferase involved in cell wall biosynthesis